MFLKIKDNEKFLKLQENQIYISQRLIYRWLYTIAINAVEHYRAITKKLCAVKRTNEVFAEYGNVGLEFDCIPSKGFSWMNTSFQVGLSIIDYNYHH